MPPVSAQPTPERYAAITAANVRAHPVWERLPEASRHALEVVSQVLPFKTNAYVVDQLIDWDRVPEDPIFQLTFPQAGMLEPEAFRAVDEAMRSGCAERLAETVTQIRRSLNPHPAGQMRDNVPMVNGERFTGAQHKYPETLLFFPAAGQTCHAYCTFCFRWPQFTGADQQRFRAQDHTLLVEYLAEHPEITDVLYTGGDPLVMGTRALERYVAPLLTDPRLRHVRSIRFGTKSVAYWPQRFVSDPDADDLLRLFERIVRSGRHLAIMGHYSHPRELSTSAAQQAVARIRGTGANIRMQSPLIQHVNDAPEIWRELWETGVRLGCIPYYFFVERDTGARRYFEVPLVRCLEVFRAAYQRVSGLARTVRGPSMSAHPGKVHILGVRDMGSQRVFLLEYLQCRNPDLVRRPFMAKFDAQATWFDQLEPATPQDAPYFAPAWSTAEPLVQLRIARSA